MYIVSHTLDKKKFFITREKQLLQSFQLMILMKNQLKNLNWFILRVLFSRFLQAQENLLEKHSELQKKMM